MDQQSIVVNREWIGIGQKLWYGMWTFPFSFIFFYLLFHSFFVFFFFQINLSFIFPFCLCYGHSLRVTCMFACTFTSHRKHKHQSPLMHVFLGHTRANSSHTHWAHSFAVRISMVSLLASTNIKVILITWLLSFLWRSTHTHTNEAPHLCTFVIPPFPHQHHRHCKSQSCHHKSPSIFASFVNSILQFISFRLYCRHIQCVPGERRTFFLPIEFESAIQFDIIELRIDFSLEFEHHRSLLANAQCVDSTLKPTRQPIDARVLFFFSSLFRLSEPGINEYTLNKTLPHRRREDTILFCIIFAVWIYISLPPHSSRVEPTDTQTIQHGKMNAGKREQKTTESHENGEVKLWNDVKRNEWICFSFFVWCVACVSFVCRGSERERYLRQQDNVLCEKSTSRSQEQQNYLY